MNFLNLLAEIETVDPEVYARFDSRRRVFGHLRGVGQRLTAAAVPVVLGSLFNKAYGQTGTTGVVSILNFALQLEYLELNFYATALSSPVGAVLSAADRAAIQLIRTDEANHVAVLRSTIAAIGGGAIAPPAASAFDFSGSRGGTRAPLFPDAFADPSTFLALGQTFEDLGVRAYKGSVTGLMSNKDLLEAALTIHSVEARHASHLRTMRRGGAQAAPGAPATAPKSWVSGTDNGGPLGAFSVPVYGAGSPANDFPAEGNTTQAGQNVLVNAGGTIGSAAATEAFDEPLDAVTVAAVARNFVTPGSNLFP